MICELCGKDVPRLHKVVIEGVIMNVCDDCARFGKEIKGNEIPKEVKYLPPEVVRERLERKKRRRKDYLDEEEVLIEDYPEVIRKAREKMGLTQDELAKRILEKKTVISKIERGEMHPDEKLIKKLEKALNIKLKEKVSVTYRKESKNTGSLTLGDLIKGAL
ncbi:putative transcription factor, MBF1 like protein [Aciduliprofundum sp. MAR08-339]|uniref:multiprotein bridging factor aMBF1 n=1 Tax=Aciduliprofundum sp. (strain MAR08-339) TaxID=673860 RepID=UPI0002A4AAEF|nr:putative transcription factor, MBF1 like protein [Aciduliprofundum sp. MAR08-339]